MPQQHHQIFHVFLGDQAGRAGPFPPFALLDVFGEDRVGDDGYLRHGGGEFPQAARHVIGRGHQPQRMKSLRAHPKGGFERVAAGVGGLVAEHDLVRQGPVRARRLQQFRHLEAAMDAGDEQHLGLARRQQLEPGFDPLAAASQHDDGVGLAVGIGDAVGDQAREIDQAAEPERREHEKKLEQAFHDFLTANATAWPAR